MKALIVFIVAGLACLLILRLMKDERNHDYPLIKSFKETNKRMYDFFSRFCRRK